MFLKLFLSIVLVAITTLAGIIIARKQKIRRDIFDELAVLNSELLCESALFKTSVIDKLNSAGGELQTTLNGAGKTLAEGENFVCNDKRLTAEQNKLVSSFVSSLGTGDFETQRQTHKMYEEKLKTVYLSQENCYQKCAKLYSRLGFASGLIIAVLLI